MSLKALIDREPIQSFDLATNCWRCKKITQIVFALDLVTETRVYIDTLSFADPLAAAFIT